MAQTPPCYLLKLPTELQLQIYELAVVENEPLIINPPCHSKNRREEERFDAPRQPPLSLTCRSIRRMALPIFYGKNIFRAALCIWGSLCVGHARKWLEAIGRENREMLRHFYFYDLNPRRVRTLFDIVFDWRDVIDFPAGAVTHLDLGTLSRDYCCVSNMVPYVEHGSKSEHVKSVMPPMWLG